MPARHYVAQARRFDAAVRCAERERQAEKLARCGAQLRARASQADVLQVPAVPGARHEAEPEVPAVRPAAAARQDAVARQPVAELWAQRGAVVALPSGQQVVQREVAGLSAARLPAV